MTHGNSASLTLGTPSYTLLSFMRLCWDSALLLWLRGKAQTDSCVTIQLLYLSPALPLTVVSRSPHSLQTPAAPHGSSALHTSAHISPSSRVLESSSLALLESIHLFSPTEQVAPPPSRLIALYSPDRAHQESRSHLWFTLQ